MADPRGEMEISFVDVPGHERLVHTMIAGAGGSRPRAPGCGGGRGGDAADARAPRRARPARRPPAASWRSPRRTWSDTDPLARRTDELREALAGGPFDGAPVVACSARSGTGIRELREAVLTAGARGAARGRGGAPLPLAFDRVFTLAGAGTVVTGTVRWGRVQAGDEVIALPAATAGAGARRAGPRRGSPGRGRASASGSRYDLPAPPSTSYRAATNSSARTLGGQRAVWR